jgi:cell division protein FtsW (lipid II flippase)
MTPAMQILVEALGWVGGALILLAYALLSAQKIDAQSKTYQLLNIVGAAGFIVNSGFKGAYPSAVLNVIWVAIGVYALARR